MPELRSNDPRVRSGLAETRHWVFGAHVGRSSRIALRWGGTLRAGRPVQEANNALSTGRRCGHTNTHILDVPLASVWGYINRRTGRVALLLNLIQRVLEVGSAVHHVGSGKKVSQKAWESGYGMKWLVSRADGVSSR
jgi:hypothetical protein